MDAREHALISDLVAEHAHQAALTAEDELTADWRRDSNRLRHETRSATPSSRRIVGWPARSAGAAG